MKEITEHPVYKQILADSFGGIMYDVANRGKYDTAEIVQLWNDLSPAYKNAAGGIIQGVFDFILE